MKRLASEAEMAGSSPAVRTKAREGRRKAFDSVSLPAG